MDSQEVQLEPPVALEVVPVAEPLYDLGTLRNLGISAAGEEVALRSPLSKLVDDAISAAARSDNTARAYRTAIGLFVQHLDAVRGDLLPAALAATWRPLASSEKIVKSGKGNFQTVWTFRGVAAVLRLVDAGTLDSFRTWREAEGDGPNTATARVYAVRVFLRVALRDQVLTPDQARVMGLKPYRQRQKRDEQPVGRRLTKPEVRALREAVDDDSGKHKATRDRAILDAMLYAGLRRDEVARLQLTDLRQDEGRWWLVLTGKGSKTRRVKVHDTLYQSLTGWLHQGNRELGVGDERVFLTVNKGDTIGKSPINASVVGRLVAEYGARAGLAPLDGPTRLSAHDLRRTCARNAYDNGAPLLLVQAMLGHSDPKTTARYIGAFDQDDKTAVDFVRY